MGRVPVLALASGLALAGSGDLALGDLESRVSHVALAGSGDVEVHATGEAHVAIHGSGDVSVTGDPERVERAVHGSGDVSVR